MREMRGLSAWLSLVIPLAALGCLDSHGLPQSDDAGQDAMVAVDRPPAHDEGQDSYGMIGDSGADAGGVIVSDAAPDAKRDGPVDGTTMFPPSCGAPGLACCPGNSCGDTGCCYFDRCFAAGGTCGPLTAICNKNGCGKCGTPGSGCCPGQVCSAPNTVCSGDVCARCGGAGERCCGNDVCNKGFLCSDADLCTECGAPNQPCCGGNLCAAGACCAGADRKCVASGGACLTESNDDAGTCHNGKCDSCGGPNQPCCQGGTCVGADSSCQDGTCQTCGGAGQRCCPGRRCKGTNVECRGDGDGQCTPCGGADQVCCVGSVCRDGACCLGGGAAAQCYAAGSDCPNDGGICKGGKCSNCGSTSQSCCVDQRCYGSGEVCAVDSQRCTTCGKGGSPACQGNVCPSGYCRSSSGICVMVGVLCGGSDGDCATNGSCGSGDSACGGLGQNCCQDRDAYCSTPGTTCDRYNTLKCVACGLLGERCCVDNSAGAPLCRAGTCQSDYCR